jgi:hypothetical protein
MTRRTGLPPARVALTAVVTLATIVGLSACAPVHVSRTVPHVGVTQVPTLSTPSPKALAAPVIRVTKTCAQLVSPSELMTAIGVTPAAIAPPDALDSDTLTQDGALSCHWSDDVAGDFQQTSNHLQLYVLPDITTTNWSQANNALSQDGETKTTLISGDAYGGCYSVAATSTECNIDTLVGTTWISAEVESLTKSFTTSDGGLTHFAALINPIVVDAQSSGFVAEPRWSDPAATAVPADCDSTLPDAEIQSVTGATNIEAIGPDEAGQLGISSSLGVEANLGFFECDLASEDQQSGFYLEVLPGGGWAWSLTKAYDSSQPGYSTVPKLGSQADEFSSPDVGTTVNWVRGDNLLTLNVGLPTASQNAPDALTLATYVNTKIAG